MKFFIVLAALVAVVACNRNPLSDEFIAEINSKARTWKAGRNFHPNTDSAMLKSLNGRVLNARSPRMRVVHHDEKEYEDLPENFDARVNWPKCHMIGEIRHQGCGDCWAFASGAAISDRTCIHSNGSVLFRYSSQQISSCCSDCGYGCNGGDERFAWNYWVKTGIVSGGAYESGKGCQPYELIANNRKHSTPQCQDQCTNPGYKVEFEADKHFGKSSYRVNNDARQIQMEIYKNGPVTAGFAAYEDIYDYVSGVYEHVTGEYEGGHAVKILGWGVEDEVDYWLIANSWGPKWGDRGFIKFLRGKNHMGIESDISAGLPK